MLQSGAKLGPYEILAPLALARWARSIARDTPLTPAVRVFTLYCKTPLLKLRMVEFIQTIQTLCGPLAILASYRAAEHQT